MDDIVKLDVGGHLYTTTRSTLTRYPDSMLGAMFSGRLSSTRDGNGAYIIDGDGPIFRYVLNFLRRGELHLADDFKDWNLLAAEAKFYQIKKLEDSVKEMRKNKLEFIEIVLLGCTCTYYGNHETLRQLPLLLEYFGSFMINRTYCNASSSKNVLDGVQRDGHFALRSASHPDHGIVNEFNRLHVNIFQEISNLGFELQTSSSAFSKYQQELRWLFARKIR